MRGETRLGDAMKFLSFLLLAAVAATPLSAQEAPPPQAKPTHKPDVAWGGTPQKKIKQMLELAGVKPGDVVYDLGSGDGRIPIAAARDFGARAVGVEVNPKLLAISRDKVKAAGLEGRVEIRDEDLFKADISDATVVTLFLWEGLNVRLIPKLKALKPGTRVVSYWHDMGGKWKPDKKIMGSPLGMLGGTIFLWIVPEH